METSTKRGLIVTGLLLAAAGGIFLYVKYKDKIKGLLPGNKPLVNSPVTNTSGPPVSSTSAGTSSQSQSVVSPGMTKADSILASNVNGANSKSVYAANDGTGVYTNDSKLAFKTTKGQLLGVVSSARPSSTGGFIIYFLGQGNQNLWIPSSLALIKTS